MKKQLTILSIIIFLVFGFCFFVTSVYADTTAPTLSPRHSPASPIAGQLVSVASTATDDYLLANTKIYLDNVNVQTCDFVGRGFSSADCSFQTTTLNVGTHTYYAVATDSVGNTTRAPLEGTLSFVVTSASDTTAPTLSPRHSPASPIAGQLVSVASIATDDYLLANTKIYLDDVNVQTCDFVGRGFSSADCSFQTTTLSVGTHTYYAVATDSVGNTTRAPLEGIKSFAVISAPIITCTSWTYSDWSACQSNDTQSRTIVSSSPNDCSGGNPVLTQSCEYTPPICTSWIYSDWSECVSGKQTRTIIYSSPENCIDGNPILSQSCQVETNSEDDTEIATQPESETSESNLKETSTEISDGDIIQCQNSSNPSAVYIVKIVGDIKYIRHIVSLDIFNYYGHLQWENLKQVDSLDDYSLSGWVRYNTGPNSTAGPTDKVYEINSDQTRHWINMTAEDFLTHGGSEPAIFNINQGELNLYTASADVMSL